MHRIWAKLVITGLNMPGEGGFASEITQRSDDSHETGSIGAPLLLRHTWMSVNPGSTQSYWSLVQVSQAIICPGKFLLYS
jgi:hypothetical protein